MASGGRGEDTALVGGRHEPARDERPLDVLLEAAVGDGPERGGTAPGLLGLRYAGPLAVPLRTGRPTLVANFVESLDGVVAAGTGAAAGGSSISGGFEADRFVMALLRSLSDAIVVGAGTLRAAPRHEWTPRGIAPRWAAECAAWRSDLGLAARPMIVVVSGRGDLPVEHPGLAGADAPAVIATTRDGAARLARAGLPAGVRVEALTGDPVVHPSDLLALLQRLDVRMAVCEGGPHLLGTLLDGHAVDELFVTVAPHLLGRAEGAHRLALVEGRAWPVGLEPWADLRSVRASGSHLFLRYALEGRPVGVD